MIKVNIYDLSRESILMIKENVNQNGGTCTEDQENKMINIICEEFSAKKKICKYISKVKSQKTI